LNFPFEIESGGVINFWMIFKSGVSVPQFSGLKQGQCEQPST